MAGTTDLKRVGIVGAGAIGSWIAARLALAGTRVSVLARGGTLDTMRSGGIRIEENGQAQTVDVAASADAAELGVQDVVVIAVKAPALAAAAEAALPMIGEATLIVPMINGVPWWFVGGEPLRSIGAERVSALLPSEHVIGCVVHAACSRPAPGRVLVKQADRLIFGEPAGGASARVAALCSLFESAGIATTASEDVRRAIWYKLWGNATINPLSALTGATADRLIADPALHGLMLEAMAELAEVGAAIGCPISESGEDRMAVTARLGAFKPSMLQDVEAGRPLEVDALLGAPREIARRHGIATPQLDRIDSMIRLLAEQKGLL